MVANSAGIETRGKDLRLGRGGRDPDWGYGSRLVGEIQAEWTGAIPHLALRSIVIPDKFCTSNILG